ncbi:MAG: hypothetical protein HQM10_10845 [Candidatus Riflebacteria bacterium]|nr:hypothetical protein [Candidatus Riflebacteria bacterium]
MNFPDSEAVCRVKDPLNWTESYCKLMVSACRELAVFHYQNCKAIDKLYRKYNFDPHSIKTEADIERIPMVGVTAMKFFLLLSLPEEKAVLKLTSSGTRGQKTQVLFDHDSLERVQSQLTVLWEQEGLVSDQPTNYLMLCYDPEQANDLGIAFSVKNEQRFAPIAESYYAVRKNKLGDWEFNMDAAVAKLRDFAKQGLPVRVSGITGFVYELLEKLENTDPIKLHPNSFLLTGGGWKAAEDKKVTRDFFRQKAMRLLGIPLENMRDGFGLAEHSAPYIECREHRFHIPVYNRILIRDPLSMKLLPPGEPGLMELVTPFNAMMPTLAILSTDLAYLDKEKCPCGWNSPTFTIIGRGGLVKQKGCAIHAGEIVKREKMK